MKLHEMEYGGELEQVLIEVERLRVELLDYYNKFGGLSHSVLLKSQELDYMLNRYLCLQSKENMSTTEYEPKRIQKTKDCSI